MRLTTFVLFVALLSLLGLLTVHEEVGRIRSGYAAAALLAERDRLRVLVADVSAEIAMLQAPERLARLNRELALGLRPLPCKAPPAVGGPLHTAMARDR